MGWEQVEEWPSTKNSDVYRGAAEVILAERSGLTRVERLRLWWHSTPELPFSDVAQDVVVTPHYVYVRRHEGGMARVRRDVLKQGSIEGGRRQYSVPNDIDMILSDRGGDDVETALFDKDRSSVWTMPVRMKGAVVIVLGMILMACVLTQAYAVEGADALGEGYYNSERAYGFYACIASWVAATAAFFYFPKRIIADAIGLRTIRGVNRGLRRTTPIESINFVEIETRSVTANHIRQTIYIVRVHAKESKQRIKLRQCGMLDDAREVAEFCARMWDVPLKALPRQGRR